MAPSRRSPGPAPVDEFGPRRPWVGHLDHRPLKGAGRFRTVPTGYTQYSGNLRQIRSIDVVLLAWTGVEVTNAASTRTTERQAVLRRGEARPQLPCARAPGPCVRTRAN